MSQLWPWHTGNYFNWIWILRATCHQSYDWHAIFKLRLLFLTDMMILVPLCRALWCILRNILTRWNKPMKSENQTIGRCEQPIKIEKSLNCSRKISTFPARVFCPFMSIYKFWNLKRQDFVTSIQFRLMTQHWDLRFP